MSHLARHEIYHGRTVTLDETLDAVEAVDAVQVQRAAQALFGGPLALSVLGRLDGWRPRRSHLRL
jgi:predicted Zn-dependent peptidase